MGTIEAVYAGVPMLGIPMIGDQSINFAGIEYANMGIRLDFDNINKENVLNALKAILTQPR